MCVVIFWMNCAATSVGLSSVYVSKSMPYSLAFANRPVTFSSQSRNQ
jgi:hypothetical protein